MEFREIHNYELCVFTIEPMPAKHENEEAAIEAVRAAIRWLNTQLPEGYIATLTSKLSKH